jgi:anti-anti-sigma factor
VEPELTIEIGADGDAPEIRLGGELDISNVGQLDEAAAPVLKDRPARLVLNVTNLRFADSSAIALWVRWASEVGQLEVRHPAALLRRVIQTMGLDQTFRVTE